MFEWKMGWFPNEYCDSGSLWYSDGGHAYRRVTSSAKLFFPVKRQRHREMINDSVHEMLDFFHIVIHISTYYNGYFFVILPLCFLFQMQLSGN